MSSRMSVANVGIYGPSSLTTIAGRMVDPDTRSLRSLLRDDSHGPIVILSERSESKDRHPPPKKQGAAPDPRILPFVTPDRYETETE
jgi:hypothetical protein